MTTLSEAISPAWRAFQKSAPVRIAPARSIDHYEQLVALMNELLEVVGDNEDHPDMDLLDLVSQLVSDFESEQVTIADASPAAVLRHLMTEHGLTQCSLKAEFGSQSVVSDVLNGKRRINARQAKALATRFNLSSGVFI